MGYRPIGVPSGICSGHGLLLPAFLHKKIGPIPMVVVAKNISCAWLPVSTVPLVPLKGKVLIEKQPPLVQGDVLIPHPAIGTNLVKIPCKGGLCPVPFGCPTLTIEDIIGGGGHTRIVVPWTIPMLGPPTVLVTGIPIARVGDDLGTKTPGKAPCWSKIATGTWTVFTI
jgi:hypothetical protein